jgi:hypothetical protein
MSDDPYAQQKAQAQKLNESMRAQDIENRVTSVRETLRHLSDADRKRVLDRALGALDSKLAVRPSGS